MFSLKMGDSMSKQKRRKEEKETEKEREREREREGVPFNVVVIGGNGVGKRMLVQQFVTNCFIDEVDPTLNYQERFSSFLFFFLFSSLIYYQVI